MSDRSPEKDALLRRFAKKYLWWQSPEDAVRDERRVAAQIMDIGEFDDVAIALRVMGSSAFRDALRHAEAGWFSPKSWAYWHYRCGLTRFDASPPPLPIRRLPH